MSDVIQKYFCNVIFEKKRGERFTPMGVLLHITL